jgi:hypothetical protein
VETKICMAPGRAAFIWIAVTAVGLACVPTASRAIAQPQLGNVGLELPSVNRQPPTNATAHPEAPPPTLPTQALFTPADWGMTRFPVTRPSEPASAGQGDDQAVSLGLPTAVGQPTGSLTARGSSVPLGGGVNLGVAQPSNNSSSASIFGPVVPFGSPAPVSGGCGEACGVAGCCEGHCCDRSWKHFGHGWKNFLHKHCTPAPAGPVCNRYYGQEPALAQPTWSWYGWGGPIAPAVNAPAYASVPTQYQPAPYFNPPSMVPSVTYGPVKNGAKSPTESIDEQNNRANPPKQPKEPDPLGPAPKDASRTAPAESLRFLGPPSTQLPKTPPASPAVIRPDTVEPPLYRGPNLPASPTSGPYGKMPPNSAPQPAGGVEPSHYRGPALPIAGQQSPYGAVRPAGYTPPPTGTPAGRPASVPAGGTNNSTAPQPRFAVPETHTKAPDLGGSANVASPLKTGVKPGTIVPTFGSATAGQQPNSIPPYTPPVNRQLVTTSYVRTQPPPSTQSVQTVATTPERPVVGLARPIVARGVAPETSVSLANPRPAPAAPSAAPSPASAPSAAPASAPSAAPTPAPTISAAASPASAPSATLSLPPTLQTQIRSILGTTGQLDEVRLLGERHLFVKLRVNRSVNPERVVNEVSRLSELQPFKVDFEVHQGP